MVSGFQQEKKTFCVKCIFIKNVPPPHFATFMVPNVQLSKMKEGGGGQGGGQNYCNTTFLPSIKYNMLCTSCGRYFYIIHKGKITGTLNKT